LENRPPSSWRVADDRHVTDDEAASVGLGFAEERLSELGAGTALEPIL
jgi:hypothetical protein